MTLDAQCGVPPRQRVWGYYATIASITTDAAPVQSALWVTSEATGPNRARNTARAAAPVGLASRLVWRVLRWPENAHQQRDGRGLELDELQPDVETSRAIGWKRLDPDDL